jgi:tRNA-Thr(GGU) m(6)t(6)A37 methyltransferase TsaA
MILSRRTILQWWAAAVAGLAARVKGEEPVAKDDRIFQLFPIGTVEAKKGPPRLRIDEAYAPALLGLDGYSHVWVFYWFDRNDTPGKRRVLQVHPRGNRQNPLTGVFACRAPVRPNLIALTLCKVLKVEGGVVTVEAIDAFDGTPVVDLKPYIPGSDRPSGEVRLPDWIRAR